MGASFSNIQVRAQGRDPQALLDAVTGCVRDALGERGFDPVEDGADRSVLVVTGPDWIGVYDELSDTLDGEAAQHLAAALSSALDTPAVTVMLHDSDVSMLELFEAGALVDRFNDNPSYFGKVSAAEREAQRGAAERWGKSLAADASVNSLQAAWRKPKQPSPDTLRETARLLGFDPAYFPLGYRYLREDPTLFGDPRVVELRFRNRHAPAPVTGPPRFAGSGWSGPPEAGLGSPLHFGATVRNEGGAGRGLTVVLSGDALEQGLATVGSLELVVSPRKPVQRWPGVLEPAPAYGHGAQCARFAEIEIDASTSQWPDPLSEQQLHARVVLETTSAGRARIDVRFEPLESPEAAGSVSLQLQVFPLVRGPLRARQGALRAKRDEHVLFALASMSVERDAAAKIADRALQRFLAQLGHESALGVTVFRSEPGARPKTSSVSAKRLLQGARWNKLRTALAQETVVQVVRPHPQEDFFARRPSDGFAFGVSAFGDEHAADPQLPTLAIWFDLEHVPTEQARQMQALLESLMSEVMTNYSGTQACVGRAANTQGRLDSTEYESACDIGGQFTLQRSWQARFVRSVGVGTLWLGAELSAAVPDREALRAAAPTEPCGNGLRITLADEGAVERVERAIAALLPSADDWLAASKARFSAL